MFDIGWSEMMVIAILALIVIGPKDLPRVLKSVSYWVRKARSLAREFQSGVDEMIREADLDDAKTLLQGGNLDVERLVEDTGGIADLAEDRALPEPGGVGGDQIGRPVAQPLHFLGIEIEIIHGSPSALKTRSRGA